MEKIKNENVRRVLVVAPLGVGGVTNMMLHIQEHIDRDKVNFDYLVFHDRVEPQENIAFELGSEKYIASVDHVRLKALRRIVRMNEIRKVCRNHNVQILHYNADCPADLTNIIAAKLGGVKYVTIHSHNAGYGTAGFGVKLVSFLMKSFIPVFCNQYYGCSDLAARFLFPNSIIESKQYSVLPNGIDLEKYYYDDLSRQQVREQLKIQDKFVIGHAGRFSDQKNHVFLIDIFDQIHKICRDSVLLLFGVGELLETIKGKVHRLDLDDFVLFCGASDYMDKMYQAMDIFLMPSLHEGLPVTGIEAQASGLKCIFADTITREVDVSRTSVFLPLDKDAGFWANKVFEEKNYVRTSGTSILKEAGYDIRTTANIIQNLYESVPVKDI